MDHRHKNLCFDRNSDNKTAATCSDFTKWRGNIFKTNNTKTVLIYDLNDLGTVCVTFNGFFWVPNLFPTFVVLKHVRLCITYQ